MPRYFFHLTDSAEQVDEEGVVLPDLAACRGEAVSTLGQLMQEDSRDFWATDDWSLRVTDEGGLTLFTLYLSAVRAAAVSARALQR